MDNIVGVIAGDEWGFAHWIDMDYKDKDDQISEIWFHYTGDQTDFRRACKELNIYVHEYLCCVECNKVLYGIYHWSQTGPVCTACDV